MQTVLEKPLLHGSAVAHLIDQTTAQKVANCYLQQQFSDSFCVNHGVRTTTAWRFLIQYHSPKMERAVVVGRLDVNTQTGAVVALCSDEITRIQERMLIQIADWRGELPVDKNGYILPSFAKRTVQGYVGTYISLFVYPDQEPQWIDGTPPCWRVLTAFSLRQQIVALPLCSIDVDARTGKVTPLSPSQLEKIKRQIRYAVANPSPSTTATS